VLLEVDGGPLSDMIFAVGFPKTGTSSLASALRRLGYKTIHGDGRGSWPGADEGVGLIQAIDAGNYRLPTFELFEAFVDNPYFAIWRKLDNAFPKAKFILTIRDEETWIDSCVRYYKGRRIRPMRAWLFGEYADPSASRLARQAWLETYRHHNAAVLDHFADSVARFLLMDITKGDGWEKLCPFLGVPIPNHPFPRANVSQGSFFESPRFKMASYRLPLWLR
jgi:hypothetical protein